MCGILGRVHRHPAQREAISDIDLSYLAHRGPDGRGVYTDSHVQFGHTRLAIIDLTDAGRQPMMSRDGRYTVTFNGEIYNHIELRIELEACGESFVSRSDTEVLLAAYKVWGRECVRHFRGMFAFALWDRTHKVLFLARDRCGEKPLFYCRDGSTLAFASELKALIPLLGSHPKLDPAVVDMYLHYQYVPEPFTLLEGIHKVPAAHTLFLDVTKWTAELHRYWNVEDVSSDIPPHDDEKTIFPQLREGLEDAVKLTLRADVPVGIALSGGIDSSAIAVYAQKNYPRPMHAFCVGYPGRPPYDERQQARSLAESLGMTVHEVELPVKDFVAFFPQLVRIMDEPIADPAAFGHYSVPRAAADVGIKVLLTGIGGDELFWGYPWVREVAVINQLLRRNPSLRTISRWARSSLAQRLLDRVSREPRFPGSVRYWAHILRNAGGIQTPAGQLRFYDAEPQFHDAFRMKSLVYGSAMRAVDAENPFRPTDIGQRNFEEIPLATIRLLFDTWLTSNCLSLGDRVSMSVGVETRLPFLDVRLIELAMNLRARYPDHKLGQKARLRGALKGVLPDEVLVRPKAGFQPPVQEWLSGVITIYGETLRGGVLTNMGVIDESKIDAVLKELPKQGWPGLFFAYKLVLLEIWYQRVVVQ